MSGAKTETVGFGAIPAEHEDGSGIEAATDGSGNDTLIGGAGDDFLHGGAGSDTAFYAEGNAGVTVTLDASGNGSATDGWGNTDTLRSIENITLGSAGPNAVSLSGVGARTIDGSAGANDTLHHTGSGVRDERGQNGDALLWCAYGRVHDTLKGIEVIDLAANDNIPSQEAERFTLRSAAA